MFFSHQMSVLSFLYNFFFTDVQSTLITLSIGYIFYKISKFYVQVYSLPPGPFPLLFIGNILLFRSNKHFDGVLREVSDKYGPIFTFWMANTPTVFISDLDIGREAFRKNDFSGRPDSYFGSALSNQEYRDVTFTDYGHTWEALRRVTHSAVQKYSTNDKLVDVVANSVDNIVDSIIKKHGINKEFDPTDYVYLTILNIVATSGVGTSYSLEDEEFKHYKYVLRDFGRQDVGNRFLLWEFSPILRFFDRKLVKKQRNLMKGMVQLIKDKYINHYKDYNPSIERDFCDALITAKNVALRDGKESSVYLTDENLAMCAFDLLFAGTDTSQQTFHWLLLLITYFPEVQQKLRQEIETEIGDRIPTHEDRNRCHYVMAVISETLRFRNVVPSGFPHKAVVTSKINDYTIPEGTGVFVYHGIILADEKHWPDAQEFRPERFLENGKYLTTRPKAFIPFGIGRRVCPGEKLAISNLFLVLARFLQKTTDYNIVLGTNGGIDPDPNVADSYSAMQYKIIFKEK